MTGMISRFRGVLGGAVASLRVLSCCMLIIFGTSSCSVHQWPDESTPAALKLDFVFSTDLPPYLTVDYETKNAVSSESEQDCSFRYTVKFYPRLPDGTFSRTEAGDYTLVLTKDDLSDLNYSTETRLPEGEWQVRCWADYVGKGSTDDLFYRTSDFSSITLPEPHAANTDRKDAFLGCADVKLVRVGSRQTPVTARLEMERPLAKFRFIATDFEALVTKVMREKMTNEEYAEWLHAMRLEKEAREAAKKASDPEPDNSWSPSKAPGFNPSDYYIRFYYTSFMPYVFDIFANKPIDSRSGVQFDSEFTPLSADEVLMGFDYVLVNGHESSVVVQVALYDRATNNLLSLSPTISVPLTRSKVTTVRGDFLTLSTGGGIGINPEFDGEYNIIIP